MRKPIEWVADYGDRLNRKDLSLGRFIEDIQRDALEAAAQEVEKVKLYAGGAKRIRALIPAKDTDHAR